MRSLISAALLICAAAWPEAPAAQGQTTEFYFLVVAGKGSFIDRIAVNGRSVIRGTVSSVSLPAPVTRSLNDGGNTLEIEYTSDPNEGLSVHIERRRKGRPEREVIVTFSSAPNETQGKKVNRSVPFTVQLARPATPAAPLTDGDRAELRKLIRGYYDALARKDQAATASLWDTALREARDVYPEGVEFHRKVMNESIGKLLSAPGFRMRPLSLDGLRFSTDGATAIVDRANGKPVFESVEVEIVEEIVMSHSGKETRDQARVKTRIEPRRLLFQNAGGRWYPTIAGLTLG